jgi:hypothetical protein
MSKKHRRQKPRKNFPWPLIALGGILLIAAAFFFANQGGGDDGGGTPSIAVDQQKIDFGYQKLGTNLTFTIKVTNTGTGALRFKEQPYVEVVEGC